MALDNHLDALKKKHADIDQKLQNELVSPAPDDLLVHHLKSLKLSVKDEIARLLRDPRAVA